MGFEVLLMMLVALLLGGFIKGFSGFGTSLFLVGVLLFFFPPNFIIPVLALLSLMLNIFLIAEHHKHIDVESFYSNFALRHETMISLVIGTFIGAILLKYLDVSLVKIIFGIVIVFIVVMLKNKVHTHEHIMSVVPRNIIIGSLTGIFSGLINVNGPIPAIYAMRHNYDKIKMLKSITIFLFIADIIAITTFLVLGLYSFESILVFVFFLPIILMGFLFGKILRQQVSDSYFKKGVLLLLFILAVKLCIDGLISLI